MANTVRDWMNDLVVFVDPNSSITEALGIMRRRYVNNLIAKKSKDSPDYGIITSIDICDNIVAHSHDPSKITVREVMSSPLITVTPEMTIQECAKIMKEKRIHHLPVADAHGTVVGMISADDFLIVAEQLGHGNGERALS